MAKVTYLGAGALAHHNNPSGTTYVFRSQKPLEVPQADAEWYALESTRGGPWKVDLGPVEATVEVVKEAISEITPKKKGGRK